ncbi:carboxyl transferase domain-containing protein [Streptomyces sp. F001]|uniref:carboxyl transferase domain-containing protein n=1 Tax=Streptomyces sp. F001 TaxID=1510026 RepID=UPI0023EA639C|nr:carboxyl transferase domain-containing protein [Streptomyces sp. F001]
MARFLQLCDAHGLPVVSLCDTPGFMVGPMRRRRRPSPLQSALRRRANLSVPVFSVVLRGYAWAPRRWPGQLPQPGGHGRLAHRRDRGGSLEGAVRLGYRRELDAIGDSEARQQAFDELLAEQYAKGKAVNAATVFELDDVIDPAETRRWITNAFTPYAARPFDGRRRSFVDTW